MKESELLNILEMENWHDIRYVEQFMTLLEHWEEIDEDILIKVFSKMHAQECKTYIEYYFNDLMSGMPNDNLVLYKIFSSVKGTLLEAASAINKDVRALGNLSYELLRFQKWLYSDDFLFCKNISDNTLTKISLYDALIAFRIDQLNAGKCHIDFPMDLEYRIDEYDYQSDEYMGFINDENDQESEEEQDYTELY